MMLYIINNTIYTGTSHNINSTCIIDLSSRALRINIIELFKLQSYFCINTTQTLDRAGQEEHPLLVNCDSLSPNLPPVRLSRQDNVSHHHALLMLLLRLLLAKSWGSSHGRRHHCCCRIDLSWPAERAVRTTRRVNDIEREGLAGKCSMVAETSAASCMGRRSGSAPRIQEMARQHAGNTAKRMEHLCYFDLHAVLYRLYPGFSIELNVPTVRYSTSKKKGDDKNTQSSTVPAAIHKINCTNFIVVNI